jgi:hypothetical protein
VKPESATLPAKNAARAFRKYRDGETEPEPALLRCPPPWQQRLA